MSDLRTMIQSPAAIKQIEAALPEHVASRRFVRSILNAINKTPKLAKCTQASFTDCMMLLAQLGLLPDGRLAHLIPYGTTCQLIVDYKGLVELAYQSGFVKSIHADVACEEDRFYVTNGLINHTIDYRKERGNPFAVYCVIELTTGGRKTEVMTLAEIEAVRARSASGKSGPWQTDWSEMAKKTVFKRAAKYVPESADLHAALVAEDDQERWHASNTLRTQNDALRQRLAAFEEEGDTIDAPAAKPAEDAAQDATAPE